MRKNGLVLAITILICVCALSACFYAPKITEYSDIKDYGVTKGTGTFKSDYRAKKEFFSFFPAEIDPSFEDVKYHYKAIDDFTFAFEASLEFKLPDDKSFSAYVGSVAPFEEFRPFPYDEKYLEYLPQENSLGLCDPDPEGAENGEGTEYFRIAYARIERVLIDPADRQVLYMMMIVAEDHHTKTTALDDFFGRFHIDPKEFEARLNEGNTSA